MAYILFCLRYLSLQSVMAYKRKYSAVGFVAVPPSPFKRAKMVGARRAGVMRRTFGYRRFGASYLNRRGVASRETGFVDLTNTNYDLDTTGDVALIATIPQGASVNQRVGKKVLLKGLRIRGLASAGTANQLVSILIVYDKRPTGSVPAVTDILATASSYSNMNDANSGRFEVLRRMDFRISGGTLDSSTRVIQEYVSLRNRPAVFKAAGTGAIGDIEQGAMYVVTIGQVTAGAAAGTVNLGFRTRFLDV